MQVVESGVAVLEKKLDKINELIESGRKDLIPERNRIIFDIETIEGNTFEDNYFDMEIL